MAELPEGFNRAFYLMVHSDVADAGVDPAGHYAEHGRREGRTGVPPRDLHPMETEIHERYEFFRKAWSALAHNGISGDYAEFGVGHGKTIWCSWRTSRSLHLNPKLWAFDSFQGLPEPAADADRHPAWAAGDFAVGLDRFLAQLSANGVPLDDVQPVPGYYADSLAADRLHLLPADLAFVYVDCDFYTSTKQVLAYLERVAKHGMVIAFDDWHCWSPDGLSGEQLALDEFRQAQPELVFHPFIQFGWHGQSFYLEDRRTR